MGDVKFLLLKKYLISEKTFIIICSCAFNVFVYWSHIAAKLLLLTFIGLKYETTSYDPLTQELKMRF